MRNNLFFSEIAYPLPKVSTQIYTILPCFCLFKLSKQLKNKHIYIFSSTPTNTHSLHYLYLPRNPPRLPYFYPPSPNTPLVATAHPFPTETPTGPHFLSPHHPSMPHELPFLPQP